jgi:hypothetical protein
MKIDLAKYSRLYVESLTYKQLTESQLALFVDENVTSSGIMITAPERLSLICDLYARYNLYNLKYYRSSASSETIEFFGRQGIGDVWTSIPYTAVGQVITAPLDGTSSKYRQLKVLHQVNAGTANAYELELYSNDVQIGFGEDGSVSELSLDFGTSTLSAHYLPVLNRNDVSHQFYCFLDPNEARSNLVSVSTGISGTYYGLYSDSISLPSNYSFSSGVFQTTQVSSNQVVLVSGTSGLYYSPVIDITSAFGKRFFWEVTTSGSNEIDLQSSIDSLPTVGIRLSHKVPSDVGWSSGTVSNDSLWSVVSGTIPFVPYTNNQIPEPETGRYVQFQVQLSSQANGQTPRLTRIGIESARTIVIGSGDTGRFYFKTLGGAYSNGYRAAADVFYYESRDIE